jgi:hypothetical protein
MTAIDNRADARAPQERINGHQLDLSGGVLKPSTKDGRDSPSAMIEHVAGRTRWRTPAQVLRDRRAARAQARDAAVAAESGMDGAAWFAALIWACFGVVAVTFVLSYHGLYEFGEKIAHQPAPLPAIVPLGVDALSLVALFATFLTSDAGIKVRAYCWMLFGFTVAVSVAGNAIYAVSEVDRIFRESGLDPVTATWDYQQYSHVAGAALWPAFAAAALHLLIIARRHLAAKRAKSRTVAQSVVQADITDQLNRARAIEMVAAGDPCSAIAEGLGVPERTVQRWTAAVRQAMAPKATPEPTTKTPAKRTRATA